MNRKIMEYATYLTYTLNGEEKSEKYHQVSREQAMDAVPERRIRAFELGGKHIQCKVIFSESTIH